MIKIIEEFEKLENSWDDIYVKDLQVYTRMYDDAMTIKDLRNALKIGKTCKEYYFRIKSEFFHKINTKIAINNIIRNLKITEKDFINNLIASKYDNEEFKELKLTIRELKSIETYSPFVEIKQVKPPRNGKWNLGHIWKSIMSGQMSHGKTNYYLTDDYAYDNAVNFGKGKVDLQELVKQLIENRSGWWCKKDKEDSNFVTLSVCCHTFDSKTLYFNKNFDVISFKACKLANKRNIKAYTIVSNRYIVWNEETKNGWLKRKFDLKVNKQVV